MEIINATDQKHIVFIYEGLGTAMLLYSINVTTNTEFGQFGVAFMLFACLLIGGPITGAHFNPAVTIGVYISNKHWKEDFTMFIITILGQICGGVFGVMLAWLTLYNR